MSRFILGNCIDVMRGFPDRAVDLIVTDPPYLVGFKDRQGRQIAGDVTDEWLQPATLEMYRVLKKDALMVSFYGWKRCGPLYGRVEGGRILCRGPACVHQKLCLQPS
ncbi:putative methylase [Klebsiella pneumoniae]|uniref:Putative methylase n=1 Tax=Klebsiella pneumoniae TaxID=573 RepID=A0A377YQP8_KLEPN|nr:putative methylase [Klebsiella pneumoniae]